MELFVLAVLTAAHVVVQSSSVLADQDRIYMVSSPESVAMPLHDETLLKCEMNVPADMLQWRHYPIKDHTDTKTPTLLSNASYTDLPVVNQTGKRSVSTLRVKEPGDYQCLAHYGASVIASVPGRITITSLESFPPQEDISITVTKGNTVAWKCKVPKSNPKAHIDYYKNDQPVYENIYEDSLIIPEAKESDSGNYSCSARNDHTANNEKSDATFSVRVVSQTTEHKPRYIIEPQKYYIVNKGESIFIECSAVGYPIPETRWYRKYRKLPKTHQNLAGGLKLSNFSASDEGVYFCENFNHLGRLVHNFTVIYHEPPNVLEGPQGKTVREGEDLDLECVVKGIPPPQISWFINGRSVINDTSIEAVGHQLYFRPVEKKHAGIIQCFASNIVGTVYKSCDLTVEPIPKSSNEPDKKPSKKKDPKKDMIPPSRPNVTRLDDESVMVRWKVPDKEGLPILFFKIQYRDLGPANHHVKSAKWETANAEINSTQRSYQIGDLQTDHIYRFRIAAVYMNNDNKLSPISQKFHLTREDFNTRNPLPVPLLTHTETINDTAIKIYWELTPNPNVTIDGFFVHYIPSDTAGEYLKSTVEGGEKRSCAINYLQPDTFYDIKLQSFNTKTASHFSPMLKQKTSSPAHGSNEVTSGSSETSTTKSSHGEERSTQMYFIIGGSVVAVALVLSLIVLFIICRKWKQSNNKTDSRDENCDNKDDPGHHISVDGEYVVNAKALSRANGCMSPPSRITITPNPLADADNKNRNVIEMSCIPSQNNNSQAASVSAPGPNAKPNHREKTKRNKYNNTNAAAGENYV